MAGPSGRGLTNYEKRGLIARNQEEGDKDMHSRTPVALERVCLGPLEGTNIPAERGAGPIRTKKRSRAEKGELGVGGNSPESSYARKNHALWSARREK